MSAGNESVVQSCLQVLHVHVFLAAALGCPPRGEVGRRPASRRSCRQEMSPPRRAADLPVQPLNHIVGTDARPMLAGEVTVGQRFLHAAANPIP